VKSVLNTSSITQSLLDLLSDVTCIVLHCRVFNVLKHWIEKTWYDFAKDCPTLSTQLSVWLDRCIDSNPAVKKVAEGVKQNLQRKLSGEEGKISKTEGKKPKPFLPKDPVGPVIDIHPEEIARQLTLIEWDIWMVLSTLLCFTLLYFTLLYWFSRCLTTRCSSLCSSWFNLGSVWIWVGWKRTRKREPHTCWLWLSVSTTCRDGWRQWFAWPRMSRSAPSPYQSLLKLLMFDLKLSSPSCGLASLLPSTSVYCIWVTWTESWKSFPVSIVGLSIASSNPGKSVPYYIVLPCIVLPVFLVFLVLSYLILSYLVLSYRLISHILLLCLVVFYYCREFQLSWRKALMSWRRSWTVRRTTPTCVNTSRKSTPPASPTSACTSPYANTNAHINNLIS